MIDLTQERDVETLRQISLLLERENQRLLTKTLQLAAENARLRGLPNPEQLALAELRPLEHRRTQALTPPAAIAAGSHAARPPRPGHGPRPQPTLPIVEIRHELPPDQRACPACGGDLTEMSGQTEDSERITTIKLTYQVEHHRRQKYRCACNGAVVTAPGPAPVIPGGRYAPEFGVSVAVAKYADHLPLERQVRMMAREGLRVDSQTLWDQLNAIAHHLEPTYEALGRRALEAPVINVDQTRWAIMGTPKPAAGTIWGVHAPTVSVYRIRPGKSTAEGREVLAGYTGIVVVDGFAVYEVLARDGPGFTLAHCWAHTKRKYDEIATMWPTACAEITALITPLSDSCHGPFQAIRQRRRSDSSSAPIAPSPCSIASGTGPPCRSGCRAAISARRCATCWSAGPA
jgi:transposase